jgi:hypothetical protein
MDYNIDKHVKVRMPNGVLGVVILDEFPDFNKEGEDYEVVVHIINKKGLIIHNEHENVRKGMTFRKGDLKVEGNRVVE